MPPPSKHKRSRRPAWPKPGPTLLGAALAAALAVPVLAMGLSARAVDHDAPARAVRFAPFSGAAQAALADQQLKAGDAAGAAAAARAALVRAPLDQAAARTLAITLRGTDPARAAALLGAAAGLGWRDPTAQFWLAAAALANGDAAASAAHADALARTAGADGPARRLLDALVANPASRPLIAARLALQPAWRPDYLLSSDGGDPADLSARGLALVALASTPAPADGRELRAVTDRLLVSGRFTDARALWRTVRGATATAGTLYDPEFRRVSGDEGSTPIFEWRLFNRAGAQAAIEPHGGAAMLHLTSDGSPSTPIATQMVMLPPGLHQLAVAGEFPGRADQGGFRWTITCVSMQSAAGASPIDGSALGPARFHFLVPADGSCPLQVVSVRAEQTDGEAGATGWVRRVALD